MASKRNLTISFCLLLLLLEIGMFAKPREIIMSKKPAVLQGESDKKEKTASASNILVAVGDIMLSRHVGEKIRLKNDPRAPFLATAELLRNADISFANLESPFYNQGARVTQGMVFKAEPETIEGLKYAGIDIVSLANNHFGDQGKGGMEFTFLHLKNNQISYVGAGKNEIEAHQPQIIERKGIRFAFLAYADVSSMTPEKYRATSTTPGVAWFTPSDLKKDVEEAKQKADVVIVSIHWGREYQQIADDRQKKIGHEIIDAGASVVLGHHPHVIQPYEKYKNGYIFYSLGNFIFDQMWSEATRRGEIAKLYFKGKEIEKVEVIPVLIEDFYQPRVITK